MTLQASIAGDSDLAGPIVFAVAFGSFIMFSGKLYFNYIYGIGLLGCVAMYCLLNLMSVAGIDIALNGKKIWIVEGQVLIVNSKCSIILQFLLAFSINSFSLYSKWINSYERTEYFKLTFPAVQFPIFRCIVDLCSVCFGILLTANRWLIWHLNPFFFIGFFGKHFNGSSCSMVCTFKQ